MSESENMYEIFLKEIQLLLMKENSHINEIYNLTKELADAFSRNDHMSVRIVLKMRGEEILEIDQIRRKISSMLFSYKSKKLRIESLLQGQEVVGQSDIEAKIFAISKRMKELTKKITEIDSVISTRLVGKK